jgi:hypothetical protein
VFRIKPKGSKAIFNADPGNRRKATQGTRPCGCWQVLFSLPIPINFYFVYFRGGKNKDELR